jgi:pimeloyl-ACP methyl ester carboxylesterase
MSVHAEGKLTERLLLLHPAFFSPRAWLPAARYLRSSFEVLVPTLAGHTGGPPFPAGVRPGTASIADQLERELDSAGWGTVHIAGCSYGGLVALELARRGRARSVFAIAPGGDYRRLGAIAFARIAMLLTANRAAARVLRPWTRRLCSSAVGRWLLFRQASAHPRRLAPDLAAELFRAIADCPDYMPLLRASLRDEPPEFGEIGCPIAVAWPVRDRLLPFSAYGRRLLRTLPAYTLCPVEDVGHAAMLDDPQGIAALIRDFTEASRRRSSALPTLASRS